MPRKPPLAGARAPFIRHGPGGISRIGITCAGDAALNGKRLYLTPP